jgi:hypothetical protein
MFWIQSFSLKDRYKGALKNVHPHNRGDINIIGKNIERTIKTGQKIILNLLGEVDDLTVAWIARRSLQR